MNEQAILSEDDDDYEREGLRVKVRKLGSSDKQGSMGLVGNDGRVTSQSRHTNNSRLSGANSRMGRQ